jgi:dihydroorotate dehydrogenase (fumarate)
MASAVDTSTRYLGLTLRHPFMAGASPMSAHLDSVRRLEDAGSAAIVLHSLFEEQITESQSGRIHGMDAHDPRFASRLAPFPPTSEYPFSPSEHLEHLRKVKAAVAIPVIASLNGIAAGAWLKHAVQFEQAGADALEINLYQVVTNPAVPATAVENDIVTAVFDLKRALRIPVAVKLSPFFTAFAHMAGKLDKAGADGLVLFNRFYQPDIDIATLTAAPALELSTSAELLLRLRWLAILHGRVGASLALTGGVETWQDGVKGILAGAHAVQMVSALLRHGPQHLGVMVEKLQAWMEWQHLSSIDEMRGRGSLLLSPDASAFERAHYIRTLHRWSA